ncbi:ubiquinone-dependent pyruvate dehydrogenase [Polymorphobacter megasporae]|uniref:ubiquinone-dependent pyruvate dehydrogenase n=1 Tax=Glacieibacterium megasporae TaxID=2835787 RepID=UPI001C1E69F5|nr:ubiquinone-dependent pyruvate dehydrogenase [Polymorphobacter megasporae]UAJ10498.1 ubiquinone-dependent pyruvate dehydrogenase [Polymorphobacter megasporae]
MSHTVADQFVETLHAAGVRRIYGLVGDSLNGITDALRRHADIEWVHVRHEEAAAFAAGAEAAVTGELAVCAGSCGPGNTHLINGLFDCHRTRVPVLAIAAQIPSAEIGRNYFQETKPDELFRACSDYCELISQPEQLPGVLETAIRSAIGRRGVSVVVVPGDVTLRSSVGSGSKPAGLRLAAPVVTPAPAELAALAAFLDAGRKVTLLCGRGCAGAHAPLMRLAEALQSPIVHAFGGKEHVEWDNPYDVGMTGLIGFKSGYKAMMDCDTLLMLGTDLPYRQFFPEHSRIAQVDIRPENIGRRAPLELGVIGDVGATIEALLPLLGRRAEPAHLRASLAHYTKSREGLNDLATGKPGEGPIHPQYLTKVINERAAADAIFTFDVGAVSIWAARYLEMNGHRRLVGSLAHGSMANALPQAIGAQASSPDRQVVSMSGDGGLAMLLGELLTLVQLKLPVKVIVYNNGSLGFVSLEMKGAGFLDFGTDLQNPDFAAVARAIGLHAQRVEDPGELEAAVADIFAHPGPALLDVVIDAQELSMPPVVTASEVKGFSLWSATAVLNGRGDEVLDLLTDGNFFKNLLGSA